MGWNAALMMTRLRGPDSILILEYANSQLLEFRHYDEWLTRELAGVYASLKSLPEFCGVGGCGPKPCA